MVAVLPWLHNPDIPHLVLGHSALILLLLLFLVNHALPALVKLHESCVLWVLDALPDVEGERQMVEYVLADE